jgi:hypothetical protein
MSDLTGSPKQIAWATTIRSGCAQSISVYAEKNAYPEARPTLIAAITALADARTEASWWIEKRPPSASPAHAAWLASALVSGAPLEVRKEIKAAVAAATG